MDSFWIITCPRTDLLWSLPIMSRTCDGFQSCRMGLTGESYSITREVTVPQSPHLPVPTQDVDTATLGSSPVLDTMHVQSALQLAALCFEGNPGHHTVGLGTNINRLLRQQVVWVQILTVYNRQVPDTVLNINLYCDKEIEGFNFSSTFFSYFQGKK